MMEAIDKKILVIDIETTDFMARGGKIVEVGIIELDLLKEQTMIVFDKVVHERPITRKEVEESWIVQNGFMTVEQIQNSCELKSVIPEIQFIIDSYPAGATAYNRSFDFDFLESRGLVFQKKLPCPMLLSTDICQLPNRNGYSGYKWPKAQEAYNFFFPDVEYIEKHRGVDDAIHEAEIILELYKRGIFKL